VVTLRASRLRRNELPTTSNELNDMPMATPQCGIWLRSCLKISQLARYGVINRFEMLIYSRVNCAFSPIYALSRTHLRNFKTASECGEGHRGKIVRSRSH
jgi:hypothetical protein